MGVKKQTGMSTRCSRVRQKIDKSMRDDQGLGWIHAEAIAKTVTKENGSVAYEASTDASAEDREREERGGREEAESEAGGRG